jgi:signal transduction histidine kinase
MPYMVQNKTMKLYPQYFIFFLILFVVSCTKKTTTTSSRNDSVEKYLKLASIDTLPTETRKEYNHKAFSFIDLEKNDSTVRWYLCETALNSMNFKDSIGYLEKSKLHLKKSKESNDTLNLARYYRYLAAFYSYDKLKPDSALHYYNKSQKLYLETNKRDELAIVYLNKGYCYSDFSDYMAAELSYNLALNIFREKKDNFKIRITLTSLGIVKHNIKNYLDAIEYHIEALKILDKIDVFHKKVVIEDMRKNSYVNIGNSYREMGQFNKAIFYFIEAQKIEGIKLNDISGYIKNNLGYCYLKQNNFERLPKLFKDAAKIFDSCGIKNEAAISRIYLAEYYAKVKDTSTAIQYANKALQLAKESKSSYYHLYTLSNAGTINKKKAPQYIAEYHRLNDSLLFEERKARNQYFKIQLETDEITQEKEKAIKQKWIQTSIITSVLLIVILLFVIYKQQSQKKEFLLIQNQQKANEEIYQLMLQQQRKEEEAKQKEKKRIALELHDNVMNKLASTRFNLFTLTQQTNTENTNNAKQHIQTIKEIEDEIRNLTHELSKEHFTEDNSFANIVAVLVHQQNQMYRTKYELQIDEEINWDTISAEIKMNLYRIIQEAIHNCNKYANATQVKINLTKENNQLQLSIKDNGIGFDVNEAKQGIGLHNMQQRIDSIRGTITIHSKPGIGTEINCNVEIKS